MSRINDPKTYSIHLAFYQEKPHHYYPKHPNWLPYFYSFDYPFRGIGLKWGTRGIYIAWGEPKGGY